VSGEHRAPVLVAKDGWWVGELSETIANYKKKGDPILLEGRLQYRTWETQDGSKRLKVDVVADNVQFLGGRADADGGARAAAVTKWRSTSTSAARCVWAPRKPDIVIDFILATGCLRLDVRSDAHEPHDDPLLRRDIRWPRGIGGAYDASPRYCWPLGCSSAQPSGAYGEENIHNLILHTCIGS
jgi:hypothetical protein